MKELSESKAAHVPLYPTSNRELISRLALAGLLTAVIDGLFSSVLSVAAYHSTVSRLFQGVAAVPLGSTALDGGTSTFVFGVLIHFGVAFGWSAVFLFIVMRWHWVRAILASRYGVVKIAALYGPIIWMTMSLILIPIVVKRPPAITIRWWVQLIGHIPFVGLPIVGSSFRSTSQSRGQ